jgi:hypothetical protein
VLGVGGVMAWRRLRVIGAARGRRHTDETLAREVTQGCLRCPPGCSRAVVVRDARSAST